MGALQMYIDDDEDDSLTAFFVWFVFLHAVTADILLYANVTVFVW